MGSSCQLQHCCHSGLVNLQEEWNCLIRGPPGLSGGSPSSPGPKWLQAGQWSQLLLLGAAVPALEGIALSMASSADEAAWQAWANSSNPHTHPLPPAWEPQVNSFQRMLLLKVGCCPVDLCFRHI